ncbi:MAG: hypothetical protein GC181_00795 [Bacteroidetes bacterium]|nr:hypothetical protein [Bacteroidota bacterium]
MFRDVVRTILLIVAIFNSNLKAQVHVSLNSATQYSFTASVVQTNSSSAAFSVEYYNPPSGLPAFVNISVQDIFSGSSIWAVQNVGLINFPDTQTWVLPFKLTDKMGYTPGIRMGSLFYHLTISDSVLTSAPVISPTDYMPVSVQHDSIAVYGDYHLNPHYRLPASTPAQIKKWFSGNTITGLYEGCNIPNIDLNAGKYSYDTVLGWDSRIPYYPGDENNCGPAAASNGISWLGMNHAELEKIFQQFFGTDSLAQRRMMSLLTNLMQKDPKNGVTPANMIAGLLQFFDSIQAPVHVKYQSAAQDAQLWGGVFSPDSRYGHRADNLSDLMNKGLPNAGVNPAWLRSELANGETVILNTMYLVDSAGYKVFRRAHSVVLTGCVHSGGFDRVHIKDDGNQKNSGGKRQRSSTMVCDSATGGAWHLPEFDEAGQQCYLNSVVSMSNDTSIHFNQPKKITGGFKDPTLDLPKDETDSFPIIGGICGFAWNEIDRDKEWYMHLKIEIPGLNENPFFFPDLPLPNDRKEFQEKIEFALPDPFNTWKYQSPDSPFVIIIDSRITNTPLNRDFIYWPPAEHPDTFKLEPNIIFNRPVTGPADTIAIPVQLEEMRITNGPVFPFSGDTIFPYFPPRDLLIHPDSLRKWPAYETALDGIDRFMSAYDDFSEGSRNDLRSSIERDVKSHEPFPDQLEMKDLIRGLTKASYENRSKLKIEFQSRSITDSIFEPDTSTYTPKAFNRSLTGANRMRPDFVINQFKSRSEILLHLARWKRIDHDSAVYLGGNVVRVKEVMSFGKNLVLSVAYDEKPFEEGGVTDDWCFIQIDSASGTWVVVNKTVSSGGTNHPGILELTTIEDIVALSYDAMAFSAVPKAFRKDWNLLVYGNPVHDWAHSGLYNSGETLEDVTIELHSSNGRIVSSIYLPVFLSNQQFALSQFPEINSVPKGVYYVTLSSRTGTRTCVFVH